MRLHELFHDNKTLNDEFKAAQKYLRGKYGEPIGRGRNRETYSSGKFVIKLPINDEGMYDNYREERTYKKYKKSTTEFAKCKIVTYNNIPLLVMEFIKEMPFNELPDWADYYDCKQVGMARDGNFKAYDYA